MRCRIARLCLCIAVMHAASCEASANGRVEIWTFPQSRVSDDGAMWETSLWPGPDVTPAWTEYPARTALVVHHPLGRVPMIALVYVSFHASGSGAALAAGDLAHINQVTDDYVELKNDTEESYFARVVLQ